MANLVNAERVSKAYGTRILLDDVSLGLAKGDVIGVVGRNGDGKTTLLSILTGRVEPDAGQVTTTGSASIGYLTQDEEFAADATVRDVIVHGEPDHVWAANALTRGIVTHLLADIDLDPPVARLSGGERRRTALVALMLAGHDLLVLDEPTGGMDPIGRMAIRRLIEALRARGKTVFFSSHELSEVERVCNRVAVIAEGRIAARGAISDLVPAGESLEGYFLKTITEASDREGGAS